MVEIYCPFDFSHFPFDKQNCNVTFGIEGKSITFIRLTPPMINYDGQFSSLGQKPLKISSESMLFYMEVSSMDTFTLELHGYSYDQTGILIHFSRKSLGDLSGSFYGPTAIFAILSLISFHIHPDKVSKYNTYRVFNK